MSTPAKGPITEYGTRSTANAIAAFAGVGWLVGENSTNAASPASSRPSPAWPTSRVPSSSRNPRTRRISRNPTPSPRLTPRP